MRAKNCGPTACRIGSKLPISFFIVLVFADGREGFDPFLRHNFDRQQVESFGGEGSHLQQSHGEDGVHSCDAFESRGRLIVAFFDMSCMGDADAIFSQLLGKVASERYRMIVDEAADADDVDLQKALSDYNYKLYDIYIRHCRGISKVKTTHR